MGAVLTLLLGIAWAWPVLGEGGRPTGQQLDVSTRFVAAAPPKGPVRTDPAALGRVAERTAEAIRGCTRPTRCGPGAFAELGVDSERVLKTLDFVARVAKEDALAGQARLRDPAFLAKHFEGWRWMPDTEAAAARNVKVTQEAIRLTKYVVYQLEGSSVRTDTFDTALYSVVGEDDGWTRFSRIDAYAGAFEAGGAGHGLLEPLVWLTREGVNRALMQGTVEVQLPDGSRTLFNVHRNNGVPWDPKIKDGNRQRRYWTFQEQPGIVGVEGVLLEPGVSVAGDIHNVGFGKLVALHDEGGVRLAVLADTGGAFQPNLFQLDWLAGTFPTHAAYLAGVAHLPRRAKATVLVVR